MSYVWFWMKTPKKIFLPWLFDLLWYFRGFYLIFIFRGLWRRWQQSVKFRTNYLFQKLKFFTNNQILKTTYLKRNTNNVQVIFSGGAFKYFLFEELLSWLLYIAIHLWIICSVCMIPIITKNIQRYINVVI